jgi:glycosyltransferase involved in cell wall biosynthesis
MFNFLHLPLITCPACSGAKGDVNFIKKLPAEKIFISILNKNCDNINIISPQIKNELIEIGVDKKKFSYIPNGVAAFLKLHKNRFQNEIKTCIFVGRLTEQKGLSYLLWAIKHVTEKKQYVTSLTIVGEGPDRGKLEELVCRLNLQKQVQFCGKVLHEHIDSYLSRHSIFVLPSLYEGAPNALLEAMAIGLPSLVTTCGGSEYLVDNSVGRVAKAGDIDSLAQSLQELLELSHEELHAMGIAARERVRKKFDINIVADQYIQLFQQHIERKLHPK